MKVTLSNKEKLNGNALSINNIRCKNCNKLLFNTGQCKGEIEIKCKCGLFNYLVFM